MKRIRKIKRSLIVLSLIVNKLWAQLPADSLAVYLLEVEANNPELKAQFYKVAAGKEKIGESGVLPDPEFEAGIYTKPMGTLMGDQLAEIRLMQMFPWFGTLKAQREAATHMSRVEQEAYNNLRQNVLFDAKKSYYTLYALQTEIDQIKHSIALLQTIEETATNRYANASSGKSSMSDVLRIQIERTELENKLLTLQDQAETLTYVFNKLLDRDGTMPVSLPDTLVILSAETDEVLLSEQVLDNNSMLKMYAAEKDVNQAELKMAKRMSFPTIGIGIEYMPLKKSANPMVMENMNGKDMIMPMVSFSIPLYRGKYKAEQRKIRYKGQAIEANAKDTQNQLLTESGEAVRMYKDALRRVALYKKQRQLSERSLSLLLTLYATSSSNVDEVLRAEQQLLDFNTKTAKALADSYIAKAWIDKLINKK